MVHHPAINAAIPSSAVSFKTFHLGSSCLALMMEHSYLDSMVLCYHLLCPWDWSLTLCQSDLHIWFKGSYVGLTNAPRNLRMAGISERIPLMHSMSIIYWDVSNRTVNPIPAAVYCTYFLFFSLIIYTRYRYLLNSTCGEPQWCNDVPGKLVQIWVNQWLHHQGGEKVEATEGVMSTEIVVYTINFH